MGADSNFEVWIVIAIVAVFAGMFLSYLLVEVPGRFLLKSIFSDSNPGRVTSRAAGTVAWTVVVIIIYSIVS